MVSENKKILAVFARSYDSSSNNRNLGVHLISSVYCQDSDFPISNLSTVLDTSEKGLVGLFPKISGTYQLIIVRIICDYTLVLTAPLIDTFDLKGFSHGPHIIEYKLSIWSWLSSLNDPELHSGVDLSWKDLLTSILGPLTNSSDKFDTYLNSTLFIFEGLSWNNIVLLHKNYNIHISGSRPSNRIFLSSIQFRLSLILGIMGINIKSVYDSFTYLRKLESSLRVQSSITLSSESESESASESESESSFLSKYLTINARLKGGLLLNFLNIAFSTHESKTSENISTLLAEAKKLENLIGSCKSVISVLEDKKSTPKNNSKLTAKRKALNEFNKNLANNQELCNKYKQNLEEIRVLKSSLNNKSIEDLEALYAKYILSSSEFFQDSRLHYIKPYVRKKLGHMQRRSYTTNSQQYLINNKYNANARCLGLDTLSSTSRFSSFNFSRLYLNPLIGVGNIRNFSKSVSCSQTNSAIVKPSFQTNSVVYTNLMTILNSDLSSQEKQMSIELYLMGINKEYQISMKKNNEKHSFSNITSEISEILFDNKEALSKLIFNFIERSYKYKNESDLLISKIYETVGIDYLLTVSFGRVLTILSANKTNNRNVYFTSIIEDLSRDIIYNYNFIQYKKNLILQGVIKENTKDVKVPYGYSLWAKKNSDLVLSFDSNLGDFIRLGSELINNLSILKIVSSDIIKINYIERRRILVPGNLFKNIDLNKLNIVTFNKFIPMLVKPKNYSLDLENDLIIPGGYLLNDKYSSESLFRQKPIQVNASKLLPQNLIIDMVNNINSVEFKINSEVFYFILDNYKKFDLITDPNIEHPYYNKPDLTVLEQKELAAFNSKKYLEQNILGLAQLLILEPKIYLPIRLDYRGRINCVCENLTFQGTELSKSLLLFAKGSNVYLNNSLAINYLKIYGANCFGHNLDKKSFLDRIDWVNENEENIINFTNGNLINICDNKLLFIAFCFEYRKYIEAKKNQAAFFVSHLPIQLDASCNGYQHLSLLTKDTNLANLLNLKSSNWQDIPDDFYSFIALKLLDYFSKELKNLNPDEETTQKIKSFTKLSKLKLINHRQLIKKSIMCLPYNVTQYSMVKYMESELVKQKDGNYISEKDSSIILTHKELHYIASAILKIIYNYFPKLKNLITYFKAIVRISSALNIPIPWILPTGLIVQQQYFGVKELKFKPFSFQKDILKIDIINNQMFDKKKQDLALMPNIIHSLDAATLTLVITKFFKETSSVSFYSIHDCFAVTCDKMQILTDILKSSYTDIYLDKNFLVEFDKHFNNIIKRILGINSYISIDSKNYIMITGKKKKLEIPNVKQVIEPVCGILGFDASSYILT